MRPHYGRTARRMLAATVLTAAPGIVPYVGWIVMLFWAPFGAVAMARLAEDLRAAEPAPEAPGRLGGLVAALGVVLLLGCGAAIWSGVRTVRAVERDPGRYEAALMRELTPSSGQAVIATLEGRATDGQKRQAYEFMLSTATSTLAAPSAPAAPAAPAGGTP
ncbi:MAG: hypothetical protein KGM24_09010 [Elusimicrobia bacterium]|nr:hypothetical protein [Elusimicrobiota bacterium]